MRIWQKMMMRVCVYLRLHRTCLLCDDCSDRFVNVLQLLFILTLNWWKIALNFVSCICSHKNSNMFFDKIHVSHTQMRHENKQYNFYFLNFPCQNLTISLTTSNNLYINNTVKQKIIFCIRDLRYEKKRLLQSVRWC